MGATKRSGRGLPDHEAAPVRAALRELVDKFAGQTALRDEIRRRGLIDIDQSSISKMLKEPPTQGVSWDTAETVAAMKGVDVYVLTGRRRVGEAPQPSFDALRSLPPGTDIEAFLAEARKYLELPAEAAEHFLQKALFTPALFDDSPALTPRELAGIAQYHYDLSLRSRARVSRQTT